ncbi:MAG: restriction endonuclease subunit S [Thaumarchaeota archaeon]|nr:restriction endonuclease subunit S [Nitrososphaerota archaeon]
MQVQKPKQGYKLVKSFFGKYEEIPEDWNMSKLDKFLKINMGQSPPSECYNDVGNGLPFFQGVTDFGDIFPEPKVWCNDARKIAEPNEILFSVRAPVGEVNLSNSKCCIGRGIASLIPNNSNMHYCFYILKQFKNHFLQYSQGTTYDAINREEIVRVKVPFTEVLSEQQKIASILSNVDSLIQQTQKEIEQTQKLKKGLMQKLFTKGIGHTKFKEVFLKFHFLRYEIPENWHVIIIKKLSTLGKDAIITGPFGLMLHSSDYVEVGTPLILIKNIQDSKIIDKDIPKVSKEDTERLSRYQVKEGDMVFSRVGRVGSAALVERKQHGWLISGQLLRIRFDNPNLNSNYLNYFIQSHLFIRTLIPELVGSTRDSINTEILENLPIIIPPKKEQDEITTILSNVDLRIEKQLEYKSNLETLKKGLMQKLLTGQIRVKV